MRRAIPFLATLAAISALAALGVRADELKLKDGTKVTGTIIGFEENSFRVKTSYGFAIVQKDQVVSISIADGSKKPDAESKPEPAAEKSAEPPKPAKKEAVKKPAAETPASKPPAASPPAAAATAKNAPPPAAPAPPPKPAASEPMREEVTGNSYTNDTYGFRMYKPPDWQLIEGARTLLPGAITAMGTGDQTTYLLIGQEPAGKSFAGDVEATERRLREIMENFRPLGEKRLTVSGLPALEHRFRGTVDQHDWSGTVVFIPRGTQFYTIFGMTYADTDLVQIQENVIARAIASLQFTQQ